MVYLAHTAHAQLGALGLSCVGWTLTAVAFGLIQWRVWLVSDSEVISSGLAWVGLWRTCFNSHTLVSPGFKIMHCRYIGLTEAFTPPEIRAGQVLMVLSLLAGLCGNAGGVYALRNVYFGMGKESPLRLSFSTGGALCLLAAAMSLIPLVWNLTSVVTNQNISFPPEFKMPQAPDSQYAGCGIGVGMVGTIMMIVSGIIFCMYKIPARPQHASQSSLKEQAHVDRSPRAQPMFDSMGGENNPAFEAHEHL
ncbi:claudin-34-like [Pleuronectes platessa]|uniref:claudin-34-like n=1 Tax=Pleuronectes platessa TaxID=8262 RepID=UPI00232A280C|nr:claudin-34-like [Pleuronectes platessa]